MLKISRREFIKKTLKLSVILTALQKLPFAPSLSFGEPANKLVVVNGGTPKERLDAIFKSFGGITKMIPKHSKITIKPNASFSRTPEQAANNDPELIFHLVKACFKTTPKEVIAFDHASDHGDIAFKINGIRENVLRAGGKIISADQEYFYQELSVPKAKTLKKQLVNKDLLTSDYFINVAIPKDHFITTLTMAIKNLMGAIWDRYSYHSNDLHECIAELTTAIRPNLNILDARRILLSRGPHGPGKVRTLNMTIASTDIVLLDSYGASLFGKRATDIPYIVHAHKLGVGQIDLNQAEIINVKL